MKKICLSLIIVVFSASFSYAQTNTFPSSGNVGIGTTSPGSDLNVFETTDSKPGGVVAPTKSILKLSRTGTPNYSYNESAEFRIGHGGPTYWGSQLDLFLNGAGNQTNVPDQQVMTWLYNGNVGIGTSTPNTKLDISGTTLIRGFGTYSYNNPGVGELQIGYGLAAPNTAGTVTRLAIQPYGHIGGPWKFDARDSSGKAFLDIYYGGTGSGSGITVNNSGNVSIGTLDGKGYKFAVNGNAIATSVTVKLSANWPDYVFKKEYRLPSLAEVKTYIEQNHHLPEMPSEQGVIKDGINLGEMNKLLTKKVEELTLYLIEKDNKISSLEKKVANQQQQITQQQMTINSQYAVSQTLQKEIDELKQQFLSLKQSK